MRGFDATGTQPTDATRAAQLRRWIIAIGVLALAAFVGSSAYDAWRSYRQVVDDTHRDLESLAKALAEQAEGSLQVIDLLLRETSAWYAAEGRGIDGRLNETLARRASGLRHVRLVAITDEHGRTRFHSRDISPVIDDVSDRAFFTAQRDHPHGGVFLSEPIVTHLENRPAVVLSRRLAKPDGRFDGVVLAVVDLEEFQNLYRAIDLGAGSAVDLMRDDGMLVVRQPAVKDLRGRMFPELAAATSAPDGLVVSPIDHKSRFAGAAPVPGFPLVAAVTRERAVVLHGWRGEALHVTVRTLVLVMLGVLAIAGLVRQLRRVEMGERALRASEERYALAMEMANEGHWDWSVVGGTSYVSPRMKTLHGRNVDAPVTTLTQWLADVNVHPDDVDRLETAARDHIEGRTEHYHLEYRVRYVDGQWHWLQVRGRCLRDAAGHAQRFLGSAIDVTARRNAEEERERLERQLRQSQKLEAMGTLAGGIAHDFNNILGAILGYGEMARKNAPHGSPQRRYLDNIMHAGGRAKALVERILAFSRSGVGDRDAVNVQAAVAETLELLSASLRPGVRLAKTLASGSAAIVGDPTQLHQVVMNLCTNAIQAMPDDGVMEVTLERVDVPLPCRVSHGALAARPYVRLRVADTGTGIPPAVRERIFDPFFTTKGVGEGTGLGLALVHGIVSDLGGAIDVSTILGQGTTFAIWLPIEGEAAEVKRDACRALPTGDGQTILVIDDERPLVMLVEETLAGLGYEAVGFDSSSDAIGAFRAAPRRFDAVLTDETMPGLKGTDLAPALRALRPDIPIILMSGYAGTQLIEHARRAGVTEILRKPLQRRDIAESLGRILGAARRRSFAPVFPEGVASASVIEEQPQATPIASQ
jgi:PAS domain S-box-containing protein